MKRTSLRNRSDKKILRDEVGALHLKLLKKKRNNYDTCEICGRHPVRLGRFHIMLVGQYPRLEFCDENILLTCWMPCHNDYHHNPEKADAIKDKIKKLQGSDYRDRLKAHSAVHRTITMTYLNMLKKAYEQELEGVL